MTVKTIQRGLTLAASFIGVFALLLAGYWLVYLKAPMFHTNLLRGEDHAIEWLTFAGFAGAALFAFLTLRWCKGMDIYTKVYFVGLALFYILCAGEEISWGQRVFGFDTPEYMSEVNEQDEFNLHNLKFEHFHPKDVVSWFMKLFGIVLPLLFIARLRRRDSRLRLYMTHLSVIPCFVFAEVINLLEGPIGRWAAYAGGRDEARILSLQVEEMVEMYWGLSIMLAMATLYGQWRALKGRSVRSQR